MSLEILNPFEPIECLSYSGGVQSHCLLEMVLRGHIPRPKKFIVLNADPGMEDERSYLFVNESRRRCLEAGIPFITASERNLYKQMIELPHNDRTRMDHPPFWTKNRTTGKKGRLKQKCTREFKIRPMRRVLRAFMAELYGNKKPYPAISWIGFAADESSRVTGKHKDEAKYITLRYPLIEMGMDRAKVEGYYLKHGIIKPPRSVCVACFANGLAHFEDMYLNRPDDWDKAVAVDEACRDMRKVGVKDECYVSQTLIPLKDLPDKDFLRGTPEGKELRCNSGVCFV